MSDGTVTERVIRVFADFKKVSTDQITTETSFEELGMDSLDGLNLVFELEEAVDITIPDDRVKEMQSVGQAIEGIEWLLEHPEDQTVPIRPAADNP